MYAYVYVSIIYIHIYMSINISIYISIICISISIYVYTDTYVYKSISIYLAIQLMQKHAPCFLKIHQYWTCIYHKTNLQEIWLQLGSTPSPDSHAVLLEDDTAKIQLWHWKQVQMLNLRNVKCQERVDIWPHSVVRGPGSWAIRHMITPTFLFRFLYDS